MKINVIVNLRIEGLHRWSKCDIPEVYFLQQTHRHIFYIEAKKEVQHSDRDIEIIRLKRNIEKHLLTFDKDFGEMSCEDIALDLVKKFNLNYCKVLEDGENGAEVTK